MNTQPWEVTLVCKVRKRVTTSDCTEEQAWKEPWDFAVDEMELEQLDWIVLSVKPARVADENKRPPKCKVCGRQAEQSMAAKDCWVFHCGCRVTWRTENLLNCHSNPTPFKEDKP